jgi:transcriptional regulator with XRE-family HTH domain
MDLALGLTIRVRRHGASLSQSELGDRIGVSFQQIQKYERGANRISFSMLSRIAEALGCCVSDLVREVEALKTDAGALPAPEALTLADAAALLDAVAQISSPLHRRAILDLARTLACEER